MSPISMHHLRRLAFLLLTALTPSLGYSDTPSSHVIHVTNDQVSFIKGAGCMASFHLKVDNPYKSKMEWQLTLPTAVTPYLFSLIPSLYSQKQIRENHYEIITSLPPSSSSHFVLNLVTERFIPSEGSLDIESLSKFIGPDTEEIEQLPLFFKWHPMSGINPKAKPIKTTDNEFFNLENYLSSITHPTLEDFQTIESLFSRPFISAMPQGNNSKVRYQVVKSSMRFVGENGEPPLFNTLYFNDNPTDKSRCIISYASYNPPYPDNLQTTLPDSLASTSFNGHFLMRVGGWPDCAGGSLPLIQSPYAFKPAFFKEVASYGYDNVLWLDTSLIAQKNLDPIFKVMEKQGYFLLSCRSGNTLLDITQKGMCSEDLFQWMDLEKGSLKNIPHINAAVFGLNLNHPHGRALLHRWLAFAWQKYPFISALPEEVPLSVALHQIGARPIVSSCRIWAPCYANLNWKKMTFFVMDDYRPKERYGIW